MNKVHVSPELRRQSAVVIMRSLEMEPDPMLPQGGRKRSQGLVCGRNCKMQNAKCKLEICILQFAFCNQADCISRKRPGKIETMHAVNGWLE